jgi:hypothetical protein
VHFYRFPKAESSLSALFSLDPNQLLLLIVSNRRVDSRRAIPLGVDEEMSDDKCLLSLAQIVGNSMTNKSPNHSAKE